MNKSNVHNLVSTMVQYGFMIKNKDTGKYSLGLKFLTYSHTIIVCMDFRKMVLPYLIRLCQSCGENVTLCVPNGTDVLYLDTLSPTVSYVQEVVMGRTTPMYCTGVGKALLAFSSKLVIDTVLSQNLIMFTEHTIVNPDILRTELELTRKRGYGIATMEWHIGRTSIGMPIFNHQGELIAGVSISGQTQQFTKEKCDSFIKMLQETIASIECANTYNSAYHYGQI